MGLTESDIMKSKLDTDILKFYLIRGAHAEGECRMEIEEACDSIANLIDNLEGRIKELEKSSKRTADIAGCLANGIQPD